MESLLVLFVYNRPKILAECINTLFKNDYIYDELLIINDGSNKETTELIVNYALRFHGNQKPQFTLINFGLNQGCGIAFETGLNYAIFREPEYLFLIESDYIFREHAIDQVIQVFKDSEEGRNSIGIAGYDQPGFYQPENLHIKWKDLMIKDLGEDNLNREIMLKPWNLETTWGKINLEYVSNSCGTFFLNWGLVKKIKTEFPEEFAKWIYGGIGKQYNEYYQGKRLANDGILSGGAAWIWNKYALKNLIDRNKFGPILNIKPSIGNHMNGGADSINGYLIPEKHTFVGSPSWHKSFDQL